MHFFKPNKKKVIFSLVIGLAYTTLNLSSLFFTGQSTYGIPSLGEPSFFDHVKFVIFTIGISIPVFLVSFLFVYFVSSIIEIIFSFFIHNRSKKD